jgi:hypothetical protein
MRVISADLLGRERRHAVEQVAADVAPERHRRARAVEDGGDREPDLGQGDGQHQGTGAPDVAGVTGEDALVDDAGVERRQVQRRHRLDELQHDDGEERTAVAIEVRPEHAQQHGSSISRSRPESAARSGSDASFGES